METAGLPYSIPAGHSPDRDFGHQERHREVFEDHDAAALRHHDWPRHPLPDPSGRTGGHRLPLPTRLVGFNDQHLPGSAGTGILLPLAGQRHGHHLRIVCVQESQYHKIGY